MKDEVDVILSKFTEMENLELKNALSQAEVAMNPRKMARHIENFSNNEEVVA